MSEGVIEFIQETYQTKVFIPLHELHSISLADDYSTLLKRSYTGCADILYKAVTLFKNGAVKGHKQSEINPVGFYCTQRKSGDEVVNWNDSAKNIFNFVRAICHPGPKARAFIGKKEMKINGVEYIENAPIYKCITGAIINKNPDGFFVKTQDGFVKVIEYEYDGKLKVGDRFAIK